MPQRAVLWETLMRQAPIAVVLIDSDERILEANPMALHLLDADAGSLDGATLEAAFGSGAGSMTTDGQPVMVRRRRASGEEQVLAVIRSNVDAAPISGMLLFRDAGLEAHAQRTSDAAAAELLMQKTLLEAQSEAAMEGILVVDPGGTILSFNRRFLELWQLSPEITASASDRAAIDAVRPLLRDPDGFAARIEQIYRDAHAVARDELQLRDGRVLSRYTAPVISGDGVSHGRVWFFNDITEQRRNEAALRFAADAADILADTLDPSVTLTRIARLAVPRLGDWCVIYRLTAENSIERVAIEFVDPADTSFARAMEGFSLDPYAGEGVAAVIRTGRSRLEPEVTPELLSVDVLDREPFAEIVREIGPTSWMCVPLEARGRVLGAMSFITSHSGRRHNEHDLAVAEDLGHRAGLAMDNAALFEQQRTIARTLQQSLLPRRLPAIDGVDVAVRYRAAGEGYDVGGDFYDLFPIGTGGWGLVIGDVVGKGPEAAALTALARYTARTAAMHDPTPSAVLTILNEAIYRHHEGERFCTAIYAHLRVTEDGLSMRLARAGHPPPLVMRASGEIDDLTPPGLPLGLFPDAALEDVEVTIEPGGGLVLYTDGVVEARSASTTMGEQGLVSILERCIDFDVDRCADEIERCVADLQSGHAQDDVAIVVLRVDGPTPGRSGATTSAWFPSTPETLREVRAFVRSTASAVASEDLVHTAVLCTGELAANAVRHARTDYRVSIGRTASVLRIEVRDLSTILPEELPRDPEATNGRGLPILASESDRWGIARRVDGKAIWFELDLDTSPA